MSPWFPIIKRIWTPSFAVYSAGWTTLMLAAFYWVVEVRGWRRWTFPLVVVGMNSIAAYVIGNAFGGWFNGASRAWLRLLAPALGPVWLPVLHQALFALTAWGVLWLYGRGLLQGLGGVRTSVIVAIMAATAVTNCSSSAAAPSQIDHHGGVPPPTAASCSSGTV